MNSTTADETTDHVWTSQLLWNIISARVASHFVHTSYELIIIAPVMKVMLIL